MKKLIAATAVTMSVMLGGAGTAFAANDGGSGSTTDQPAGRAAPASGKALRREVVRTAGAAAAQALGVDVADLRPPLEGGQSIAAYATSRGIDVSKVTGAVVAALTQKVDDAVKAGKVTEAQAVKLESRVAELVDRLVQRVPQRRGGLTRT